MEGCVERNCWRWYVFDEASDFGWRAQTDERVSGPAHAVYFGTYEIVKEMAGGNVDDGHHPLAAGKRLEGPSISCGVA
jgi:hypothetical protein